MTNTATATRTSASAISRILSSNKSLPKARPTGWSEGFTVIGYGALVEVDYQTTDKALERRMFDEILKTINERPDRKYLAEEVTNQYGQQIIKVTVRPETKEDLMEKAAEESPYAVTKKEVNRVLRDGCYAYSDWSSEKAAGYVIERAEAPHDRLVRVTYKDHPHTGYALVVGGREQYMKDVVKLYADKLRSAGFSVKVEGDYESVLVGVPGEFPSEDDPQEVKEALNALREAVEADSLSYMTRKAGPHSLFVYYLVPFKDKVRRCEVFRSEGVYKVHGRFGGTVGRVESVARVVELIRGELAD